MFWLQKLGAAVLQQRVNSQPAAPQRGSRRTCLVRSCMQCRNGHQVMKGYSVLLSRMAPLRGGLLGADRTPNSLAGTVTPCKSLSPGSPTVI